MAKILSKNITFYVGIFAMFVAGILYVLISDIGMGNSAQWLFGGITIALASNVCAIFGENIKDDNPTLCTVLKAIAIALAAIFVVYIYLFKNAPICQPANLKFDDKKIAARDATIAFSLIFGYISIVVQAANLALGLVFKEE